MFLTYPFVRVVSICNVWGMEVDIVVRFQMAREVFTFSIKKAIISLETYMSLPYFLGEIV